MSEYPWRTTHLHGSAYFTFPLNIKKFAKVFLTWVSKIKLLLKHDERWDLSFSTIKDSGLFAWVRVKAHFSLESPLIDLIYTNHHLIHLQKCQHCGFTTLFNIIWKKIFITNLPFLNRFTVFGWCSLKVKQSILFVEQK